MHHFAQTIFEMGQSVPENGTIDPKSYIPGRTAISNAVKGLSSKPRQDFVSELRKGSLQYGGPIEIEGVHLKVQGKHFYDFTLHFTGEVSMGSFKNRLSRLETFPCLL